MTAAVPDARVDQLLGFWFGELDERGMASPEVQSRWWQKDADFDREIETRFSSLHRDAAVGALGAWLEQPRSRLAFVITLDQLSRNLYRGSGRAYAYDRTALEAAKRGIDLGMDREVRFSERGFYYLPLMHSERLVDQHLCVRLFEVLAEESEGDRREAALESRKFAIRHLEIVERFGRFPHRNEVLGRTSSEEELEFLEQPGSSF